MAGWDWPSTAVGAPESWPLPLRTMVRVLLTSRFSMWLGWGPELSFFYNDAYRRDTLGVKHPWALGRPASEVWAEIWPDIAPRVDAVMSHGTATWDEDLLLFLERSGYREETYHTFSYSPVPDADGQVGGLLCVVTEQTERVISDRRMATLRRLASGLAGVREEAQVLEVVRSNLAANGKDLPFALLYLSEPDGTARLACASGLPAGHPAAPAQIHPGGPAAAWGRVSAARGPVIV